MYHESEELEIVFSCSSFSSTDLQISAVIEILMAQPNSKEPNCQYYKVNLTRVPPLTLSFPRKNVWQGSNGLLPCKGHQRSSSDVPLGFLTMIKSSPLLVPINGQVVLGKTMLIRENLGKIGVRKSEGKVGDDLFNSWMKFDSVDSSNSSCIEDKDKDIVDCGTRMSGGDNNSIESESISRHGLSTREDFKRSMVGILRLQPDATGVFRWIVLLEI
ncbi:uncharacterized protein LOC111395356 [Olea europaea var. sylvestris]|uniref:uncharacterized protein LOC111395356 n=1 Tax=Olea europaea var. sylvestris TaxID=158386 RepID=UPI000C1D5D65|nr:uncharacterized protein LOC111395356 [Olea europaea var. sylvestris]